MPYLYINVCDLWFDSVSVGKLEEAKKVLQEAIDTVEKSPTAQNEYCKVSVCTPVCTACTCTYIRLSVYLVGSRNFSSKQIPTHTSYDVHCTFLWCV